MNSPERVTVGITAYRVGDYLEACWESLVSQTVESWNCVLVLDGEIDEKTSRVFNSIEHPRLKKIRLEKNGGPYATRSAAIANCESEWYCQLDGDDTLPKDSLENIHSAIARNPKAEYVYGPTLFFGSVTDRVCHPESDPDQLCHSPLFNAASPIKLSLYRRLGGFCTDLKWLNADWDFWLSVYESGTEGEKIDEIIYNRRVRADSVGNQQLLKREKVAEQIILRHPKFFSQGKRIRKCRGKIFELMAREYRRLGNRELASNYAKKALESGADSRTLLEIIQEGHMTAIRYQLRRWLRKMMRARQVHG